MFNHSTKVYALAHWHLSRIDYWRHGKGSEYGDHAKEMIRSILRDVRSANKVALWLAKEVD